ncbi:hypothetical protein AJ80_02709 [Polytolypa hystricis UAMH7299]|uniref:FAR-17a/AIG1-like protein n=1 Tax=Polytolypa hystricis (strain UAMH7299) TaxID=1447883 RepID=A0A2B7YQN1_POLH7|nr:hypothetical protein AJ80_02709 [Polytolypa hystricis UAMH7299]
MPSFNSLMGANPAHDSQHHFETSWLFRPTILAAIRALLSLYAFTTIFFIFGWNGTHDNAQSSRRSFSYFTHLSYWGVAFYFLFAALHTFLYARTGRSVLLDKWPRSLRALHSLLYSTATVFPFLVMIVYWALLYDGTWFPETFSAWTNISQHLLQAVFALFEIIFPATPTPPLLHIPFLIFILLLYLSLAYLTHATQGFYSYSFLNPGEDGEHSARVAGYAFGILAAVLVIFAVVWVLVWGRERLVGKGRVKWAEKDERRGGRGGVGDVEGGPVMEERK